MRRGREALRNFEAGGLPVKAATDGDIEALAKIKGDLDSLSEAGEMDSLRLHMAMDRLSKLIENKRYCFLDQAKHQIVDSPTAPAFVRYWSNSGQGRASACQ